MPHNFRDTEPTRFREAASRRYRRVSGGGGIGLPQDLHCTVFRAPPGATTCSFLQEGHVLFCHSDEAIII